MISCFVVPFVNASCECGYMAQVDALEARFIYTDLIESDFLHIRDIFLDTDWRPQSFNKTPAVGRGPYGYVILPLDLPANLPAALYIDH